MSGSQDAPFPGDYHPTQESPCVLSERDFAFSHDFPSSTPEQAYLFGDSMPNSTVDGFPLNRTFGSGLARSTGSRTSLSSPFHTSHQTFSPGDGGLYRHHTITPFDYTPTALFQPDTSKQLFNGISSGFGVGGVPPTPLSGNLPPSSFRGVSSTPLEPATVQRSLPQPTSGASSPPDAAIQNCNLTNVIGKTPQNRQRSASRPTPYRIQSRSNSVSLKSEGEEEVMSVYSSASNNSAYQVSWSNSAAMIVGDIGQMSLEHRRSLSNPHEIPSMSSNGFLRSRSHSFSLGKKSSNLNFLDTSIDLSGPATDREAAIRSDLADKASHVLSLTNAQIDKGRAIWAKRWLKFCYKSEAGYTVPRQGLYCSYTQSCEEFGIRPINSASFGKVVRATFPGIRTRRLGIRGNSKYHYVSLRPAISTEAQRLNVFGDSSGQLHIAAPDPNETNPNMEVVTDDESDEGEYDDLADLFESIPHSLATAEPFMSARRFMGRSRSISVDEPTAISSGHREHLRRHTSSTPALSTYAANNNELSNSAYTGRPLPKVPAMFIGADATTRIFWGRFRSHHEILARCVTELHFDRYELNYRNFWSTLSAETTRCCSQQPLATMIVNATALSFDHFVQSLVDRLNSPIPSGSHNTLGLLARNFEAITHECLGGMPEAVSRGFLKLSRHLSHLLSRFLDLYQVTTALKPFLADRQKVMNVHVSWRALDSGIIAHQSAESCGCAESTIAQAFAEFEDWLSQLSSLPSEANAIDQLARWVDNALVQVESMQMTIGTMRTYIPLVNYITSQVMRMLTLRSDPSFGWFQLLKTWLDDYIGIFCVRNALFIHHDPTLSSDLQLINTHQSYCANGTTPHLALSNDLTFDSTDAQYLDLPPLDTSAITPRPLDTQRSLQNLFSRPVHSFRDRAAL